MATTQLCIKAGKCEPRLDTQIMVLQGAGMDQAPHHSPVLFLSPPTQLHKNHLNTRKKDWVLEIVSHRLQLRPLCLGPDANHRLGMKARK
jgi:hypothetical protein